jgi:Uma2 family endonuclease
MRVEVKYVEAVGEYQYNGDGRVMSCRRINMPVPQEKGKYTYQDYLTWNDDERWEIIDGVPYCMTPSPAPSHQECVRNIVTLLSNALKGKRCKPFVAPIDVVLSEHHVVQPDVFVICDPAKITDRNVQGAPDVVLEVLSPFTGKKDKSVKKDSYEMHGVKEFILVDPFIKCLEHFILQDRQYGKSEVLGLEDVLHLQTLEGLALPVWGIFGEDKPANGAGSCSNGT